MLRTKWFRSLVVLLSLSLLAAVCGGDDDDSASSKPTTTAAGGDSTDSTEPDDGGDSGGGYEFDASDCPEEATTPIEGTIKIGSTMPLSGGVAATAFAPVAEGIKAYIAYANEKKVVDGYDVELTIEDDQYKDSLTTPAVEKLIDETGVNLFAGMIGTPNNLAVRDTLNEECYPQLFALSGAPAFGDVANYPFTMGGLPPYNTETAIYVEDIKSQFPDGATVAVHHVNSAFGDYYSSTLESLAGDANLDIVADTTIEAEDANPPTSQIGEIAEAKPDVIIAAPLGAQCISFLSELAKAKASTAGWEPRLYITSTCASPLILGIAGPAADGLFTVSGSIDVADPKNAELPNVKEFHDFMISQGFAADGDFATAAAGWTTGESIVAVLAAAAESGEVTRVSILNAARNLDYTPSFFREGVSLKTDGEDDGFPLESFQIIQFDADSKTYTEIGDVVSEFEGQTEVE